MKAEGTKFNDLSSSIYNAKKKKKCSNVHYGDRSYVFRTVGRRTTPPTKIENRITKSLTDSDVKGTSVRRKLIFQREN